MQNINADIESTREQVARLAESMGHSKIVLDNPISQDVSEEDPVTRLMSQFMTLRLLIGHFTTTFDQEFMPYIQQTKNQSNVHDFDPERHVIGKTASDVLSMFVQMQDALSSLQSIHGMYSQLAGDEIGGHIAKVAQQSNQQFGEEVLHELTSRISVLENSLERMSIEKKRNRLSTKVIGLSGIY
jgi:hypothetical protein